MTKRELTEGLKNILSYYGATVKNINVNLNAYTYDMTICYAAASYKIYGDLYCYNCSKVVVNTFCIEGSHNCNNSEFIAMMDDISTLLTNYVLGTKEKTLVS